MFDFAISFVVAQKLSFSHASILGVGLKAVHGQIVEGVNTFGRYGVQIADRVGRMDAVGFIAIDGVGSLSLRARFKNA